MSTKVVLPSFTISGRGPHPAIRVLWASGVLLVVATLVLGAAVWHRQRVDAAVVAAAAKAMAAPAEQQPLVAAQAAGSASPSLAPQPMPASAPAAPATAAVAVALAAPVREAAPVPGRHRHRHHLRGVRSSPHGKAVAVRGSGDMRASRKSSGRNDEAIDRLLKQFK